MTAQMTLESESASVLELVADYARGLGIRLTGWPTPPRRHPRAVARFA